jgi:hypothetical protein
VKLESAEAVNVVTDAVDGVVAPTVPLILIEAVPVKFVTIPLLGVPRAGVTSVGLVANTLAPEPVSSVSAVASWAEVKDPSDAALPTLVTAPVRFALVVVFPAVKLAAVPVMFVPTSADGVPSAGVTSVGLVLRTVAPVPVEVVTPVPPLATGSVPVVPASIGRPVTLVITPEAGVPNAGVTNAGVTSVGLVANTLAPEPVSSVSAVASCAEVNDPSDAALPTLVTAPVRLALVVVFPAVRPAAVPVMFVPTKADGVPRAGVTSVGLVANTLAPDPVSSVSAVASCKEVNDPSDAALPTLVTAPVRFALVVTLPAVKLAAVPVTLVITPEAGVPNAGVTNAGVTRVGLVFSTVEPVPVEVVTPVPP